MTNPWRMILEQDIDPAQHLASLEAVWRAMDEKQAPPTLFLRTLRPCLLIGASQKAEAVLNLDFCQKAGLPIFRRPSEGGAVILDGGSLVFSLAFPLSAFPALNEDTSLEIWSTPILDFLADLSLPGTFRFPNDILISGRKICGTTLTRFYDVYSFSGTLLVSTDFSLYNSAFQAKPFAANQQELPLLSQRLITLSQALARPPSIGEVASHLAHAFTAFLKVSFTEGPLTNTEAAMTGVLRRQTVRPLNVFSREPKEFSQPFLRESYS